MCVCVGGAPTRWGATDNYMCPMVLYDQRVFWCEQIITQVPACLCVRCLNGRLSLSCNMPLYYPAIVFMYVFFQAVLCFNFIFLDWKT